METLPMTTGTDASESGQPQDKFLDKLADLAVKWRTHDTTDLELRHQTGKMLNDHCDPTSRQTRGEGTLKGAAEQLGTSVSDLSRMRAFAARFKSCSDLQLESPEAKTWTAVKKLLPKRTSSPRKAQPATAKPTPTGPTAAQPPTFDGVKQSLAALTSELRAVQGEPGVEEREALLKTFREIAGALEKCLKVRVEVSELQAGETPAADQPA